MKSELFSLTLGLSLLMTTLPSYSQQTRDQHDPYYVSPSWDQRLPPTTQFLKLSNFQGGGANVYLDRNTGLVWQIPNGVDRNSNGTALSLTTVEASTNCAGFAIGGYYGWRLPTAPEVYTLFGVDNNGNTFLPNLAGITPSIQVINSTGADNGVDIPTTTHALDNNSYTINLALFTPNGGGWSEVNPKIGSGELTYLLCVRAPGAGEFQ